MTALSVDSKLSEVYVVVSVSENESLRSGNVSLLCMYVHKYVFLHNVWLINDSVVLIVFVSPVGF